MRQGQVLQHPVPGAAQGNTVLTQTSGEMADTLLIHVISVLNLAMDEN